MVMREVVTVQMQTVVIREVVVVGEESRLEFPMAPFVPDRNHGTGQPRAQYPGHVDYLPGGFSANHSTGITRSEDASSNSHRLPELVCVRSLFSRVEFSSLSSSSLLTQESQLTPSTNVHLEMKRLCSASLIGFGFLSRPQRCFRRL